MILSFRYIFNVTENSPLFSEIGSVLARDDDKGINGRISYHIRNITSFPFNIHSNNGSIYVNGPIDYEEDHEFKLLIEAIDGGFINKNSSVEVSILVLDLDDNLPSFDSNSFQFYASFF